MSKRKEVLTLAEAADLLRVHRETVVQWTKAPHYLPHQRPGKKYLFSRAAILAWLERRQGA